MSEAPETIYLYDRAANAFSERVSDAQIGYVHPSVAYSYASEVERLKQSLEDQANTIAHLREELSCALAATEDQHKLIEALKRQHAEEIERLKADWQKLLDEMDAELSNEIADNEIIKEENESLRKQAERYEKLRVTSAADFAYIRKYAFKSTEKPMGEAFDDLVDQLPASGNSKAAESRFCIFEDCDLDPIAGSPYCEGHKAGEEEIEKQARRAE